MTAPLLPTPSAFSIQRGGFGGASGNSYHGRGRHRGGWRGYRGSNHGNSGLVGSRCLGLVFSSIPMAFLTQTIIFKMLNVNCAMLLDIQQNIVLNLFHSICRLLLTWHFEILSSRLQVGFPIRVRISM